MTAATTAANPESAHRGLVTVSVMLATIMQALDTTIANVALPHMQGTMGATQDQIAWVLTSYIVAAAIFMPLTGFLTARWGRKRVFMWSVGRLHDSVDAVRPVRVVLRSVRMLSLSRLPAPRHDFQRVQGIAQFIAVRGQSVGDFRRDGRFVVTVDQPFALEHAQPVGQHLRGNALELPFQRPEA